MGCLIFSVVLAVPRLIMVALWILGDYLSTAFGSWIWPFLGFFVLPTTTLAYAVAQNRYDGVTGWGLALVLLGVLIDLGALGGGRGLLGRRAARSG
ncbi:MAG TPA: hypothetical protein VFZ75_07410 [Actinomycetota bacterium]|nr:hypothetical protein [Actinomycetota bacterium]